MLSNDSRARRICHALTYLKNERKFRLYRLKLRFASFANLPNHNINNRPDNILYALSQILIISFGFGQTEVAQGFENAYQLGVFECLSIIMNECTSGNGISTDRRHAGNFFDSRLKFFTFFRMSLEPGALDPQSAGCAVNVVFHSNILHRRLDPLHDLETTDNKSEGNRSVIYNHFSLLKIVNISMTGTTEATRIIMKVEYGPKNVQGLSRPPGSITFIP